MGIGTKSTTHFDVKMVCMTDQEEYASTPVIFSSCSIEKTRGVCDDKGASNVPFSVDANRWHSISRNIMHNNVSKIVKLGFLILKQIEIYGLPNIPYDEER